MMNCCFYLWSTTILSYLREQIDHEVTQSFTIPFGLAADLYFIAPHMHLLGKNISVDAEYPDGSASCLIDIPQWDFNWQRFYGTLSHCLWDRVPALP